MKKLTLRDRLEMYGMFVGMALYAGITSLWLIILAGGHLNNFLGLCGGSNFIISVIFLVIALAHRKKYSVVTNEEL